MNLIFYQKPMDMKKLCLSAAGRFWMVLALCFMQLMAIAQDGTANTTTTTTPTKTTTTTTWYLQPWVWVVGGILLLIILIALFRGGSTDREVTRTTVIKTDKEI